MQTVFRDCSDRNWRNQWYYRWATFQNFDITSRLKQKWIHTPLLRVGYRTKCIWTGKPLPDDSHDRHQKTTAPPRRVSWSAHTTNTKGHNCAYQCFFCDRLNLTPIWHPNWLRKQINLASNLTISLWFFYRQPHFEFQFSSNLTSNFTFNLKYSFIPIWNWNWI